MISVQEALDRVLALIPVLDGETVALREAAGRVLASPAAAERDQPPFDASAMDGYAIRAADAANGARLAVIGEAGAGHAFAGEVRAGQAARIFTGAPVPRGADSVVIQENVQREGEAITLTGPVEVGANIRTRGSDFARGQRLLPGRRLGAAEIGLLAAMNLPTVTVARRPVVAILSTGDELVQPGETPREDQIIASGALALAALVEARGARARVLPIARDNAASLAGMLSLCQGADLILTIGGASVGEHDVMAKVAGSLGLDFDFHKVALRPGKPLLAGRYRGVPLIGLPGNPVSAMICAMLFALPAIRAMQGEAVISPRPRRAICTLSLPANGNRAHYMRARLEDGPDLPRIAPVASQDSARLWLLADASALLIRAPEAPALEAGGMVDYLPLGD